MDNSIREVLILGILGFVFCIPLLAYKNSLNLEPNADRAYYKLGLKALESGDYGKAIVAIKTATEIDAKPYLYWHKLGVAYEKQGQYSLAIKAYKKSISRCQLNNEIKAELYLELGDLYNKKHQPQQAISYFERAVKIDRRLVIADGEQKARAVTQDSEESLNIQANLSEITNTKIIEQKSNINNEG